MTTKKKCLVLALTASLLVVVAIITGGCRIRNPKAESADLPCEHQWNTGEVTQVATCVEEGQFTKTCALCQETMTESLELVAHTEVKAQAKSPTCENTGLTEGTKCSVCGISIVQQKVIAALGHTVVVDQQIEPTCAVVGQTEGAHCGECGKVLLEQEPIPALSHELEESDAFAATCEATGFTGGEKCMNCDYVASGEVIPALGHFWSEYTYTQGKCDEERYGLHTCLREECGKKEAVTFPPIGHNFNAGTVTDQATCENTGLLVKQCLNDGCGIYWTETLPALGHDYVDGTCSVCGASEETATLSGTWVWNEHPNFGSADVCLLYSVPELSYTAGEYVCHGMEIWDDPEQVLYDDDGESRDLIAYGYMSSVGGKAWQFESLRTIAFDGEQTVSKAFYDWFIMNAEKQGG